MKKTLDIKKIKKEEKGITLIVLVVTIMVLLILAGVTTSILIGDNGIITQANNAKLSTELSSYKEQLEFYKASKYIENKDFIAETLTAGKSNLIYNTQSKEEKGNIETIITDMHDKYLEKLEVIKGKLLLNTKDKQEIKVAQSLGIEVNPYDIAEDGTLLSSDKNLLLMDEKTGTLTLPDSVTAIGEGAFANLNGLKTIIIPSSVKRIETNAFRDNKTLETVIMQEEEADKKIKGVEYIGSDAFRDCTNLETVQVANSVEKTGGQVFYGDVKLQNINIPNGLTEISTNMFSQCKSLKELELPEGITEIFNSAFSDCASLEKIKIPSTLNKIDGTAFNNCKNLKDIELSENKNFEFENGILLGSNGTEIVIILEDAIKNNTLVIPNTVTSLKEGQINAFTQLTSVNIPASVTNIEANFFKSNNITSINIDSANPKYEIYGNAIYTKESTGEDVEILRYFGNEDSVEIRENTKIIKRDCFTNKKLSQLKIPETMEKIEEFAFYYCNNLKSISLGKNVNVFHNMSIYGSAIEEIIVDANNPNYGVRDGAVCNGEKTKALYNKDGSIFISPIKPIGEIQTYEIPTKIDDIKVTEIADFAFHNQNKMTNIIIPNTIERIKDSFNYCTGLTKIEIPNGVKEISNSCFSNSINLKEIIIHNKKGSISGSPWGCVFGDRAIIWDE